MDTLTKTKNLQDVDRCVKCNHERSIRRWHGFCQWRPSNDVVRDRVCGCKCEFPSPSVSEAEDKNKNSVSVGKEHRASPSTESAISPKLSAAPALERCPKCHLAYVEGSNGVCVTDHAFVPNQQCSGLTCEICGNNKEWHVERDEHLRRRRDLMPDYDRRLKDWLS